MRPAKLLPYLFAIALVVAASAFTALLNPRVSFVPSAAFVLAVIFASWRGNIIAGVLAGVLGALVRQCMYLQQADSAWRVADTINVFTFVLVAALISGLMRGLRRQQAKLRANAEEFRMLFSSVRNYAIFSIDPAGRITSWNEGCRDVLGYERDEFIGMGFVELFTTEDRAAGVPQRERRQALDEGFGGDDRWMVRKSGDRFWASGLVHVIRTEDGEAVGFSKVLRDLTDRKELEITLKKSHGQLTEYASELEERVAQRTSELQASLKGIEELLYTIAHDLRAPNRTMRGFAELLEHDYGARLDETARGYLRRIASAAARNDVLIHDLLEYGRLAHTEVPRAVVDPKQSIGEAIDDLHEEIKHRTAIIRVQDEFPPVLGNRTLLKQVFVNVISNAIRYVPPERAPEVSIHSEAQNGNLIIRVEDNGSGLPPHLIERAFHPFIRFSRDSSIGTGMGLAIVRKAVERMQGKVGLESEEGKGTSVWIELPTAAKMGS